MQHTYGRYTNKSSLTQRRKELRNNQTKAEQELWKYLRAQQLGVKFRRQYSIGNYIVDFYCHELRLIIELDGWVHGEEVNRKKDAIRQNKLESKGYIVKRYRNEQVKYERKNVIQNIIYTINNIQSSTDPSSPPLLGEESEHLCNK
jgi:very-short-patch-repair endonuclease